LVESVTLNHLNIGQTDMTDETKTNILIVDDVPDKLLAFEAILADLDQNIVTVNSGRDALRRLLHEEFAVILLDVNMPIMDGLETAALIRQRKKTEHTPIIFITAYSDDLHLAQGYSLGAVDFILTPVVPEVLRAKVAVFVELFRKNEQIKRQAEARIALATEQAARLAAEDATRRSTFLAEASRVLSRSLDFNATIAGLLQLSVPQLADVAVLTTADASGVQQTHVAWDEGNHCVTQLRGEEHVPAEIAAEIHRAGAGETVTNDSIVVVPLVARHKKLGVLALGMSHSGRVFTSRDHSMAEDLAGRVTIALENASLYHEIQDADRRKDEFLAMLAHELRNPLGAVSNAIACMDVDLIDPSDFANVRDVLQRQVSQMVRLVDDLLDVSRITRGKVELRKQLIDVQSMVTGAVATTAPMITAQRHRLEVSIPDEPLYLLADPTRLEQILANLLNNAAKYTPPGGKIELEVVPEGTDVLLRVRDNGVGVSAELLPRMFDLFIQGERAADRSQGGLGIGLTLVRRLVELHSGHIEVFSAGAQQGSEFTIRLPTASTAEHQLAGDSQEKPATATSEKRSVLVIDDNADLLLVTTALLRRLGHEVFSACDGPSGIEQASLHQPDVILIDIGLPGMSGLDVAKHLRSQPCFERVTLAAMTGYGQADDHRRSKEVGFDHHLVKPVQLQSLTDLLAAAKPLISADV
jgi:signal transduction histidine kinase/response regulator RpfG family c-di-GMP phosphodiesterase